MSNSTPISSTPLTSEPQAESTPAAPTATTASPTQVRLWSLLITGAPLALILLGIWMTPSSRGIGTHAENFLLPPCGMYKVTGIPCPTCGCTTAFTWLVHGHPIQSFITQPFGFAFALATLITFFLGLLGLITGRWYGPKPFTFQWYFRQIIWGVGTVLILGWGYKIYMITHFPPH